MGLEIEYIEGQTPLDEEEKEGLLIETITTREELDEFEQQNVEKAIEWTMGKRFKPERIFTEEFVCELHDKMFGEVWKWAGEFRKSNKNIGCDWHKIGILLKQLNDDAKYWTENANLCGRRNCDQIQAWNSKHSLFFQRKWPALTPDW
jgi:Fic-DOC domain mobile mystery protein B